MLDIKIEYHSGVPVYKQVLQEIVIAISTGKLRVGERLPPIRVFAEQLNVNPNTIVKVYRELELRNVIESKRGSGCFVLPQQQAEQDPQVKKQKMEQLLQKMLLEAKGLLIAEDEMISFIANKE